jgi:hypothetical protein
MVAFGSNENEVLIMKRWTVKMRGGLLVLLLLSACTAGELTMGFPENGNSSHDPSRTKLPSLTPTETIDASTPTPLNTIIPIPSPTEGTPPDVELLNLTLRYNGGGDGFLFGEIRNNTDTAIVFPRTDISILRLQINAWELTPWGGTLWHHEFSVNKGSINTPTTNCLLYPGESGFIRVDTPRCQAYPDNCISGWTELDEPPAATGMQLLGYQDLKTYIPWPDLSPIYHPQVQNLEYSLTDQRLEFGFDLPKSIFHPIYDFLTWIVLYDENGEVLGDLYKGYSELLRTDNGGDSYHIAGYYDLYPVSPIGEDYFRGDVPDEYFKRIDHIRVMLEMQHLYLCNYNRYDDYREWMMEHPEFNGA